MDLGLHGRRAFISGSTRGIGYAIAEALLREGASVVIHGRGAQRVQSAVAALADGAPGADVTGIAADVADPEQFDRLLRRLGHVDILVNNVGVFEVADFEDITDADWERYVQINLMSGVRLSRHVLARMRANGWGRIIFISSESGVNIPADMIHYGTTKAAMLGLANGLAKLTRGTEVTVNSILGGPTYSDGVARAVERIAGEQSVDPADLKHAIAASNRTSLLERFIDPSEIASLALYLASPLSSATNGAALRADGGTLTGVL